jgi:hypothetical protein
LIRRCSNRFALIRWQFIASTRECVLHAKQINVLLTSPFETNSADVLLTKIPIPVVRQYFNLQLRVLLRRTSSPSVPMLADGLEVCRTLKLYADKPRAGFLLRRNAKSLRSWKQTLACVGTPHASMLVRSVSSVTAACKRKSQNGTSIEQNGSKPIQKRKATMGSPRADAITHGNDHDHGQSRAFRFALLAVSLWR